MSKKSFQTDEEKIIEEAKAILGDKKRDREELKAGFADLLKSYRKLYKQHRFLIKRGDKQELEMRRINDELKQTNELLKGTLANGTMRIRDDLLVQVMNLTGELVLTRNQLIEASKDENARERKTEGFLQNLDMVTTALQERIMQTRLQPIGNVFVTLPKIITAESQRLRKLIRLEIGGSDVKLDKTVLDALSAPLARIVRNACEHGIEIPAERYEGKKPETGTVDVAAFRESGQIGIVIRDDGQGIDPGLVKKKALKEGIRTRSELSRMSDKDTLSLLLVPGFSELGRMGSVVEGQGGTIEIVSERGKGTSVRLNLPVTLAIIPCLIVAVGEDRYAIPKASVDELVCLYDEEIRTRVEYAGDREVFRLREALVPVVRMAEVLARPRKFSKADRSEIAEKHSRDAGPVPEGGGGARETLMFAVVRAGNRKYGLVVDRISGSEEIVVSSMHPRLKSLGIYSGTTIMGDGTVALILDVRKIADHAGVFVRSGGEDGEGKALSESGDSRRVLVFEVGPDERFALPLEMIRRVREISPERIEEVGSRLYVTVEGVPTLVIRPDRLLDVSPCAGSGVMYLVLPRHAERPFCILISRLIDVVAAPPALNEESLRTDGVLGTAILLGRMTLFPDLPRLLEKASPGTGQGSEPSRSPDRARILLVEGAAFFRHLVRDHLESGGHRVDTAEDGPEALGRMGDGTFDLVVSATDMPGADTPSLLRQIRDDERHRHVPVLALIRPDSTEDRDKAEIAGFDACVSRTDREGLLGSVARVLKGKGHER